MRINPIHLAFIKCPEMCGNGVRIAGTTLMKGLQMMGLPGEIFRGAKLPVAFCAGAPGTTGLNSCVPLIATGAIRLTVATLGVFVSPERLAQRVVRFLGLSWCIA